ncbi:hypothetical protein [Xylophilus sp. GOD-11R]|uniref:hypothetical protein n=1 Tax=Xylophilus sp. GOD-11R TaxID=3089814 RepID=UPI00298D5A76|nr:hypothetical protein [Xylophilus sp. GOD-11R]WPB55036.1 hypothetical protein R9X41_12735 [Xylophilus sp. GOD-11R]
MPTLTSLENRFTVELERALTDSLRVPGTRHEVLSAFLTVSDDLLKTMPANEQEFGRCQAIRSRRANAVRDLLGINARYC